MTKISNIISDEKFEIKSTCGFNTTGPRVDEPRQINYSKISKRLHLTKGVHLKIAHEKLPIKQAVYFYIPNGRMMLAIPIGKVTFLKQQILIVKKIKIL